MTKENVKSFSDEQLVELAQQKNENAIEESHFLFDCKYTIFFNYIRV